MTNAEWIADQCEEIVRLIDDGSMGCAMDALENLASAAKRRFDEADAKHKDADLFTALRHILAFNDGVFLLKDGERIVVGVPVETICYAKVGEGWDEREAVMAAYEAHKVTPPIEREVVRT